MVASKSLIGNRPISLAMKYMSLSNNRRFVDMRAEDASFVAKWAEEDRLCAIIESERTSTEEKYQALMRLAYLSGVFVSELAVAA
jgi:hypothetical protein